MSMRLARRISKKVSISRKRELQLVGIEIKRELEKDIVKRRVGRKTNIPKEIARLNKSIRERELTKGKKGLVAMKKLKSKLEEELREINKPTPKKSKKPRAKSKKPRAKPKRAKAKKKN